LNNNTQERIMDSKYELLEVIALITANVLMFLVGFGFAMSCFRP